MAALLLWLGLSLACMPLISLGTDEAWVLQGLRCWLEPPREDYSVSAIHTNGGLHALANVLIERAAGNLVWAHRLFSWACLMTLVALVACAGRRAGGSTTAGLVATALLIGMPGLAENGTATLGTSSGVLLLVLATWTWARRRSESPGAVIICGLMYGMAAASRFELLLAVPAVVLFGCVSERAGAWPRLRFPSAELAVASLSAAVLVGNYQAHSAVAPPQDPGGHTLSATGLGFLFDLDQPKILARLVDYPRVLNRVKKAQEFCPLSMLVLATLVPFALGAAGNEDALAARLVRPTALFVLIGWALWLGWLLRAPIPHLRYLLPALACFAIVGGLGLARLFGWARETGHRPAGTGVLLLALAQVLGGVGPTFRNVVHGEHDRQSFEWAGWQGLDYFRRFQHVQDQRAMIAFLERHLPDDAPLLSPAQPFILRYLLERPVIHASRLAPDDRVRGEPAYLILTPVVQPMVGDPWIRQHCRPVVAFGQYALYEVQRPPSPDVPQREAPSPRPIFGSVTPG